MPSLTIAAATVNSPDWNELFVQSIRKFTRAPYSLLVVDNGSLDMNLAWLRAQSDVTLIENGTNLGHGGAMDQATRWAADHGSDYLAFFDIDSHVQRDGWETDLVAQYEDAQTCRLIGVVGPEHKPLHPPLFFFSPAFIVENGLTWQYQPGHPRSTDTAQKVYWDIKGLGYDVIRLEKGQKIYPAELDVDEILIGGVSSVAHFWYGSRFQEKGLHPKDVLDGLTIAQHIDRKNKLFGLDSIQEILAYRA